MLKVTYSNELTIKCYPIINYIPYIVFVNNLKVLNTGDVLNGRN